MTCPVCGAEMVLTSGLFEGPHVCDRCGWAEQPTDTPGIRERRMEAQRATWQAARTGTPARDDVPVEVTIQLDPQLARRLKLIAIEGGYYFATGEIDWVMAIRQGLQGMQGNPSRFDLDRYDRAQNSDR